MAYRQVLRRVAMMDWAYTKGYYELAAVCARHIAEYYMTLSIDEADKSWHLASDLWDLETTIWYQLEARRRLGNRGAHAKEHEMDKATAEVVVRAALQVVTWYAARVRAIRARV